MNRDYVYLILMLVGYVFIILYQSSFVENYLYIIARKEMFCFFIVIAISVVSLYYWIEYFKKKVKWKNKYVVGSVDVIQKFFLLTYLMTAWLYIHLLLGVL